MSVSSALSSESDEKQLLVHQTSGTSIIDIDDFVSFTKRYPTSRMNKGVNCGGVNTSNAGSLKTTACRGSITSVESSSSGGIGTCSPNSGSVSSRQCSHSPSGLDRIKNVGYPK